MLKNVEVKPLPDFMLSFREHTKERRLRLIFTLINLSKHDEDYFYLTDQIADCLIGIYSSSTSRDPAGNGLNKEILTFLFGAGIFTDNPFLSEPTFNQEEFAFLVGEFGWDIQHMQFRQIYSLALSVYHQLPEKYFDFKELVAKPAIHRYVKSLLDISALERIKRNQNYFEKEILAASNSED